MPFLWIRNDITKVQADAIVNPANIWLKEGSGTSRAIFIAAGEKKMVAACKKIGYCAIGKAVITKGYGLPAKYVIHAVGPAWQGGYCEEDKMLYSAYMEAMKIAREYKLESIAFPLLSSGNYGYPKERALKVAVSAVSDFLMEHDMLVFMVIYDRKSLAVSQKLFASIEEYIDDHYVEENNEEFYPDVFCKSENAPANFAVNRRIQERRRIENEARESWSTQNEDALKQEKHLSAPDIVSAVYDIPEACESVDGECSEFRDFAGAINLKGGINLAGAKAPAVTKDSAGVKAPAVTKDSAGTIDSAGPIDSPEPWNSPVFPSPIPATVSIDSDRPVSAAAAGPHAASAAVSFARSKAPLALPPGRKLEDLMKNMGESFSQMLMRLINERGLTDAQVYHKANIDRRHFSKIRKNVDYMPNKKTVIAFAVALELSLDEADDLLRAAGYSFTNSSKFDVIIEYFMVNGIYDIFEINEILFTYEQPLLGG